MHDVLSLGLAFSGQPWSSGWRGGDSSLSLGSVDVAHALCNLALKGRVVTEDEDVNADRDRSFLKVGRRSTLPSARRTSTQNTSGARITNRCVRDPALNHNTATAAQLEQASNLT